MEIAPSSSCCEKGANTPKKEHAPGFGSRAVYEKRTGASSESCQGSSLSFTVPLGNARYGQMRGLPRYLVIPNVNAKGSVRSRIVEIR